MRHSVECAAKINSAGNPTIVPPRSPIRALRLLLPPSLTISLQYTLLSAPFGADYDFEISDGSDAETRTESKRDFVTFS